MSSAGRNRIRAVVRCRPVTEEDYRCCKLQRHLLHSCVGIKPDKRSILVSKDAYTAKEIKVDHAFSGSADQQSIYDLACKDVVSDAFAGYHSSILSYGQTGSGKTYTMFGCGVDAVAASRPMGGIAQHALADLFKLSEKRHSEGLFCALQLSMYQIYQEGITDLLVRPAEQLLPMEPFSPGFEKGNELYMFKLKQRHLEIREYPDKSVVIDGLTQHPVASLGEAESLLSVGLTNRITCSLTANEHSSRSHVILQISITCQELVEDGSCSQKIRTSNLMCVDLAGSERIRKSGSINDARTMGEAMSINKSISALGLCINTLATAGDRGLQAPHVPFRNSKLTRVLSEAIGGRARACVIATVGPCLYNVEETLSTLQFAKRCTAVKKNVRRVKSKLPNFFDDKLIAWTWQSKRASPSSAFSTPLGNGETGVSEGSRASEEDLVGAETHYSPLDRLFRDNDLPQTPPASDAVETGGSKGSVRWVQFRSNETGVRVFATPDDQDLLSMRSSDSTGDIQRGLMVLLPESELASSGISSITIETGVSILQAPPSFIIEACSKCDDGVQNTALVEDTDDAMRAAEDLFHLYNDDDDEFQEESGFKPVHRGSLAVSSSSGSPVSLNEEGSISPRYDLVVGRLSMPGPDSSVFMETLSASSPNDANSAYSVTAEHFSTLHRPTELLEPDECPHSIAICEPAPDVAQPPLELYNAATTGINSPSYKEHKKNSLKMLPLGWLHELSDIFEGEDQAVHSPARKLSNIMGIPPVIPKLEIPISVDTFASTLSSDSFDSDDPGTDRSDFMAKMTDSPPSDMRTTLLPSAIPERQISIELLEEKIEAIQSTQEVIKSILLKLQYLYIDGNNKLAELVSLRSSNNSSKTPECDERNVLKTESYMTGENSCSLSTSEKFNQVAVLSAYPASDSAAREKEGECVSVYAPPVLYDLPPGSNQAMQLSDVLSPTHVRSSLSVLCNALEDSSNEEARASINLLNTTLIDQNKSPDDQPTSARSADNSSPLSTGAVRRDSVGPGTYRAMTRRPSLSDAAAQPRRSSMSEYLLATSPTQHRSKNVLSDGSNA